MNLKTASANCIPMDEAVKSAAVTDQHNESSVEYRVLPEGSIAADSKNVGTMDEAVKSTAIPDQQNEKSVESGVLPEGSSDANYEKN